MIHEELSTLILRRAKDPRLDPITITSVELSPDLQNALVYYSVLGDDEAKRDAKAGLEQANGFLRHELGNNLPLRLTPTLTFRFDESLEHGLHIDQILDDILAEEGDSEAADEADS